MKERELVAAAAAEGAVKVCRGGQERADVVGRKEVRKMFHSLGLSPLQAEHWGPGGLFLMWGSLYWTHNLVVYSHCGARDALLIKLG